MKIWELQPLNPDHPNWGASTRNDRVVVRAETADRARQVAHGAFAVSHMHVPGTDTIHSPWNHHDMVVCRELTGGGFTADGDEAILDPVGHDSEARRLETAES